jgi:hypothetical protein
MQPTEQRTRDDAPDLLDRDILDTPDTRIAVLMSMNPVHPGMYQQAEIASPGHHHQDRDYFVRQQRPFYSSLEQALRKQGQHEREACAACSLTFRSVSGREL